MYLKASLIEFLQTQYNNNKSTVVMLLPVPPVSKMFSCFLDLRHLNTQTHGHTNSIT
jgi:hypothetical protein